MGSFVVGLILADETEQVTKYSNLEPFYCIQIVVKLY